MRKKRGSGSGGADRVHSRKRRDKEQVECYFTGAERGRGRSQRRVVPEIDEGERTWLKAAGSVDTSSLKVRTNSRRLAAVEGES